MAEVVAPGSPAHPQAQQQPQQAQAQAQAPLQSAPHGKKRPAENSLEHEHRLSKRFDLLNLLDDNGTRLYIGVPGSSSSSALQSPAAKAVQPPQPTISHNKRSHRPRPPPDEDVMQVEDTPHRVYIADLNAELSDIESDEDTPIFLSDIEKHLSKIPRHILLGPEPKTPEDSQLVLYNVPTSLSVPEEHDNVRKAIVEARRRIREKQANPVTEPDGVHGATTGMLDIPPAEDDDDAMDID
ncbi:uncharacterized protein K460DRAFT_296012 [Cucurbitaria berberidis CBS 394.84]|uniref:Uncharacterized protein n=1 Tax=Cucurbitaria berberidis CBS 394.84 TaxID=1168544 RepID=A0A9P4G7G3_9PLEO|nr:uncharacterized protein K460DRAFT_296012 [Cucurbitaria berberidis CBS 394.84]KAF1840453.1 hypothetical protein K460DRAFT_296012 [Cucurbitaria berberidis CBS 394.84]